MDVVMFGNLMKYISIAAGVIGTLFGVDLIFGAKATLALKKILDKSTDIVDRVIIGPHPKRIFGLIILILSLIILFLISRTTL